MEEITPEEMSLIEENSEYLGVSKLLLMENAGKTIADLVKEKLASTSNKKVIVLAGLGNNGGDGFVCARHLAAYGIKVAVILLGNSKEIKTVDAASNWKVLESMKYSLECFPVDSASSLEFVKKKIEDAGVIVDAIFGTGIKGKIRAPWSSAIDLINAAKGIKVSVDIPSGLDPLTGEIHDKSIKADVTITMHRIKQGLLEKGNITGKIVVSNIGLPPEAEIIVGPGDLRNSIKQREPYSKKGDFGRLLIVGGSKDYSGAPALASLAALRTGADLAIVAAPKSVSNTIRSFSPNLIVRQLSDDYLVPKDLSQLRNIAKDCTSIVIGPGLGLEKETMDAINSFIEEMKHIPMLVDADAFKALSNNPRILFNCPAVITPHSREFTIVTKSSLTNPEKLDERKKQVLTEASKLGVTILLKGHDDIISDGKRTKINLTGNPGMTVGGTGDVLSGIVATFLGWMISPFRAACAGAFVSGLAGDLAIKEKGYHIVATDIIERIGEIMKDYERIKIS